MPEFSFRKETNVFRFSELEVGEQIAFEKALHTQSLAAPADGAFANVFDY